MIKGCPVALDLPPSGNPSSSPLSSSEEYHILVEQGKKADRLSAIPPKLRELMAGLHSGIVQKCCRSFFKKKVRSHIKRSGLYLNKQALPCTVSMTLPVVCVTTHCPYPLPSADIVITTPTAGVLTPQTVCASLKCLVGHGNTKCTAAYVDVDFRLNSVCNVGE